MSEIADTLGKLRAVSKLRPPRPPAPPIDLRPACAFGALVDERLKAMASDIAEVKTRVNALLFAVVVAVVVDIVMRLVR